MNRIGKQSKPIKITSTVENKRQRLRERRCKHKDNTQCVIEEETETLDVKPLATLQAVNNPLNNAYNALLLKLAALIFASSESVGVSFGLV